MCWRLSLLNYSTGCHLNDALPSCSWRHSTLPWWKSQDLTLLIWVHIAQYQTCWFCQLSSSLYANWWITWWSLAIAAMWISSRSGHTNKCCTICFAGCRPSQFSCVNPFGLVCSFWCGQTFNSTPAPAITSGFSYTYLAGDNMSFVGLLGQLICGMPQGSILRPILFILYTTDLISHH